VDWKSIFGTWRKVFSNWKYLILTLFIALSFYSLNILFSSWGTLRSIYPSFGFFGSVKFFYILAIGFWHTVKLHSFVSLVFISIALGMLLSLMMYKIRAGNTKSNKKVGLFGGIGIFLAALAPGCAACGVGLLSILGLNAAFLSFLPFDGLEISILAISIMGFTIVKITNDMSSCNACQIKLNNVKGGINK
jgi:hypothetical protein